MDLVTYALVKKKAPVFLEDNVSRFSSVSPFSIPMGFTTKEYVSSSNDLGYPVKPPFVLYSYKNQKVVHQYIVSGDGGGYFQRTGDVVGNSWNDWEPLGGGGGGLDIIFNDGKSVGVAHNGSLGDFATAVGYKSSAPSRGGTSYGSYSSTLGEESTSLGYSARSIAGGVSVGATASTSGANSVSVGHSSSSLGTECVNIGYQSISSFYNNTVVIGSSSKAEADSAISIGNKSTSKGVSIGPNTQSEEKGVSVGHLSTSGPQSVSVGYLAKTSKEFSVAVGNRSAVTGNGVVVGNNSSADSGVSIGNGAYSMGNSIAVGGKSDSGRSGIAIGETARSTVGFGVAVGYGATTNTDSVSIGNMAKTGQWAVAIGNFATASGMMSISLGTRNVSTGSNVVLIGNNISTDSTVRNTTIIKNSKIILDGDVEMPKMSRAVVAQNAMLLDMEMREIEREIYGG